MTSEYHSHNNITTVFADKLFWGSGPNPLKSPFSLYKYIPHHIFLMWSRGSVISLLLHKEIPLLLLQIERLVF